MSQCHATSCTNARAKEEIYSHEGMVAVALTLLWFNSLGWSVTPTLASLTKVEDHERAWNYYIKPQIQRRLRVCHEYQSRSRLKTTTMVQKVLAESKMDSKWTLKWFKQSNRKLKFLFSQRKCSKFVFYLTTYAKKTTSFYTIVSSDFVIYTVTITKIYCYTLVS